MPFARFRAASQRLQLFQEISMITLTLVDDEPFVRHALRMLLTLEPDLTIVGEAADGETAIALVESMRPDVVLMDVTMPELDGIGGTAGLQGTAPGSVVTSISLT